MTGIPGESTDPERPTYIPAMNFELTHVARGRERGRHAAPRDPMPVPGAAFLAKTAAAWIGSSVALTGALLAASDDARGAVRTAVAQPDLPPANETGT